MRTLSVGNTDILKVCEALKVDRVLPEMVPVLVLVIRAVACTVTVAIVICSLGEVATVAGGVQRISPDVLSIVMPCGACSKRLMTSAVWRRVRGD